MLKEQGEIPIAGRKEASPRVESGCTKAAEGSRGKLRPRPEGFLSFL